MGITYQPCGHGQRAVSTGRVGGYSKHAKFVGLQYVGQHTKQTNKKRRK